MGTSITLVSDHLSEIREFSWTCKRKYQLSKGKSSKEAHAHLPGACQRSD